MDIVKQAVEQEFKNKAFDFIPLFPCVLVRVLPRPLETSSGRIILPEDHNKGNHSVLFEGVVVRTYAPKEVNYKGKKIVLDSGLEVGDCVLFPHWSGEPIKGLDDESYRLVPARGALSSAGDRSSGEILGVLSKANHVTEDKLTEMLLTHMSETSSSSPEQTMRIFARRFKQDYEIIEKVTDPIMKK